MHLKISEAHLPGISNPVLRIKANNSQYVTNYARRDPLSQFVRHVTIRSAEITVAIRQSRYREAEHAKKTASEH